MKRISQGLAVPAATLTFLFLYLLGCGDYDRQALLNLKFRDNQKLFYRSEIKKSTEIHENNKLVFSNSGKTSLNTVEEVRELLGEDSARVRLVYSKAPGSPLASDTLISFDSVMIEYIQNGRGLIVEFVREDSGNSDMINYYEKLYEQMAPMYPEEPVTRGYTWSNSVKLLLADGEITDAATTYKVRAFVREGGYDCAVVEYTGNTIVPYRHELNGSRIIRLDKRSARGVFYLAYREGFIVKLEEIFEYVGEGTRYDDNAKADFVVKESGTYSYHLLRTEGVR